MEKRTPFTVGAALARAREHEPKEPPREALTPSITHAAQAFRPFIFFPTIADIRKRSPYL
jgi:hypothetical protein